MLKKSAPILILLLTLVLPPFFWTLTPNFFTTPKELLLALITLTTLAFFLFDTLKAKKLVLPTLTTALPLLFIAATLAISLLTNPEGRPEALGGKGGSLLSLTLLSLLLIPKITPSLKSLLGRSLLWLGGILSLHSLLSLTFLAKSTYLPTYMQTITFTPTGSYLTTLILILISLVYGLTILKQSGVKLPLVSVLVLNLMASVAIIALMFPPGGLSPILLDYSSSWSIALDALKSFRSLLFGIGLSNYSLLYTAVKPLSINATRLWDALPSTASSELLTLLPTVGLLTTLSLLYLTIKTVFHSRRTPYFLPSILLLLSLLLLPASLPLYVLLFVGYSLNHQPGNTELPLNRLTLPMTLISLTLIGVGLTYPTLRIALSEHYIRRAALALSSGESQKVYDYHLRALEINPRITNYHLSFADINLRLASALSQKTDLSETDRETIARLVQQSIESGKRGITLRPNDTRSWLTLAKIYQNLINVATGSEDFALEAYNRAIYLDRANPTLRLEYAGLLSQLASRESTATISATYRGRAINEVQTAIQLKSDYANAYYNLAKLYETAGDKTRAASALELILSLLDPNSSDYTTVKNELANLTSTPPTSPTPSPQPENSSSSLTTPSPLPEPIDGGPIEIPTE